MKKVITIDENVVADIQMKDISMQTANDVIAKLIDAHQLDTDTSVLDSPVFKAYHDSAVEKRLAFENAKDAMVLKYIPKEFQDRVKNWNLNYSTNELTILL